MKITLKNENGTYTIKSEQEIVHITEYFNRLIIPVLLASGLTPKTIKRGLEEDYGLSE